MSSNCSLCLRVQQLLKDQPAHLIAEFSSSIFIVGDHQFFPGYSVLIAKSHQREMHDLAEEKQQLLMRELMRAGSAIAKAFQPWKMNYASLGNQDPHLHWHLFPRYITDPNHRNHPWTDAPSFAQFTTTEQLAKDVAARLRNQLSLDSP